MHQIHQSNATFTKIDKLAIDSLDSPESPDPLKSPYSPKTSWPNLAQWNNVIIILGHLESVR